MGALIVSHTVECLACGHVGKTKTKGSFFITFILLWFAILPGVLYEIWRRSGVKVCSACGSSNVRLFKPEPKVIQETKTEEIANKSKFNKTKLVSSDGLAYNAGHRTQLDENGIEQKNCQFCKELIRFDAIKCKHCGSMLSG